jgi:hypothetical protein
MGVLGCELRWQLGDGTRVESVLPVRLMGLLGHFFLLRLISIAVIGPSGAAWPSVDGAATARRLWRRA